MNDTTTNTYHLISLGCPKNLVDSESMAQLLNQQGFLPVDIPGQASYLIVNTCGFLKSARDEALGVLTDLASEKLPWQKLIVTGCMTEMHRDEILNFVPGVDGLLGTRRWMDIWEVVQKTNQLHHAKPYTHFPEAAHVGKDEKGTLRAAIQGGSSYLKIADGCRRTCAYCLIPLIKGTAVSRPMDEIINNAAMLQKSGVEEIILIAQDITDYGHDIGIKDGLTQLLKNMLSAIPDVPWIRLMYTFPGYITESLIQLMASEPQILPYLDLPLQHADPNILQAMRRPKDISAVRKTIDQLRSQMDDIALRTTFIVGYPGEDEKAFQNLVNFIQEIQFDHIGAFLYSFERGTPAEPLGDPISEHIKIERLEYLMQIQAGISLKKNQKFIGKILDVLVEGVDDENQISVGRSYRDAPEVDGLVLIEGVAPVGELVKVKINSAITHDLVGKLIPTD